MRRFLHRIGAALLLGATLSACAQMDHAMRRVDVLDRIFDPGRYRTADAAADGPVGVPVAGPPKDPLAAETGADQGGEGGIESGAVVDGASPRAGELPPGWYVPEPPTTPEEPPVAQAVPDAAPQAAMPVDPAARTAALLRQNPWISRFWSELTAAEQGRVLRALARRGTAGPAPASWDPMGLADRVELLFGPPRATS